MLKKHRYGIRRLSGEQKFTTQQDGCRCHTTNSVTNCLNENVPDYISKEKWLSNSCDFNLLDYAIWDTMEKIVCKHVEWYGEIEGLSAVISDAWDRLTKKFINNSITQWWMRLEKAIEEESGHIELLIWRLWLMILLTFL